MPHKYTGIFDHGLVELMDAMLEVDPEYRITISEVLMHPYFDRVKELPPMLSKKQERSK